MNNHFCSLGSKLASGIPDTVFQPEDVDKLQKLQNRAARIITWADYSSRSSDVLNSLKWSNLEERGKRHLLIMMFKVLNR